MSSKFSNQEVNQLKETLMNRCQMLLESTDQVGRTPEYHFILNEDDDKLTITLEVMRGNKVIHREKDHIEALFE